MQLLLCLVLSHNNINLHVLAAGPMSYAGAYNSSSTEGKLEVLLPVPAGQQELAELLVKGEQALLAGSVNKVAITPMACPQHTKCHSW